MRGLKKKELETKNIKNKNKQILVLCGWRQKLKEKTEKRKDQIIYSILSVPFFCFLFIYFSFLSCIPGPEAWDLRKKNSPLRPSSSGKGMGRVCGRFRVQVPIGTKIYLSKKKNSTLEFLRDYYWTINFSIPARCFLNNTD